MSTAQTLQSCVLLLPMTTIVIGSTRRDDSPHDIIDTNIKLQNTIFSIASKVQKTQGFSKLVYRGNPGEKGNFPGVE